MPYIDQKSKDRLTHGESEAQSVGELTYLLTMHCIHADDGGYAPIESALWLDIDGYLNNLIDGDDYAHNYAVYCGVVGSLECARREYRRRRPDSYLAADEVLSEVLANFYSRKVAPYEDLKIAQNGDVF